MSQQQDNPPSPSTNELDNLLKEELPFIDPGDPTYDDLKAKLESHIQKAVVEAKIDLISWCLSRTSMDELKQRWYELKQEEAALQKQVDTPAGQK